jgi:transposase
LHFQGLRSQDLQRERDEMMGKGGGDQSSLFYSFNLNEHIPADHLLRGIDRFLDLQDLRGYLAPFYSHTGRPSVDPELMVRMLLVGYCFGIRSERRLCEEVHLNLAYRWFCRLGLEAPIPDHSTFSKNRHGRFRESDVFRHVFEGVVQRCMTEGLVRGEGFAVDASVVKADANRQRGVSSEEPIDWGNPALGTRAAHEYLQGLEQGAQVGKTPMNFSLTDPAARWTAAPGGPAFYAYCTNYLIDVHAGVIVDVEATAAHRTEEVEATKRMIDRVEERFDLKPQHLIGDMAYGSAPMLGWLVDEKHIEPHIPVWDKSDRKDGTFNRSEFTFDAHANRYTCPAGKFLKPTWRMKKRNPNMYRASQLDCQLCPLKSKCCPQAPHRKLERNPFEPARELARALQQTARYQQSRRDRKKVEMLFAHMKRILRVDRLRLRGRSGAKDEFLLTAIAQNLRRLALSFPLNQIEATPAPT